MDLLTLIMLVAGFIILISGAELLVRGAAQLASDMGISPLVVGLTVVSFGTSAPELAVSVSSAWNGQAGLALGNVVGSNICNILLILGVSALVAPLMVSRQVVRLEVPIMIAAAVLLLLFSLNGGLERWEGLLMFTCAMIYVVWTVVRSLRENREKPPQCELPAGPRPRRLWQIVQIVAGLAMLGLGSRWLVQGAVTIATCLGVSDLVIGLTVVAIGTSLPELATSALAALRGQRDIAVGNVVGSNIFNILVVMGLTASVAPSTIAVPHQALMLDLPIMLAACLACLPIFLTGHRIARWEGGLFFAYFIAYTVFTVLNSLHHPRMGLFVQAMVFFFIPLSLVTLILSLWRSLRQRHKIT
ncbi:cation transporter, putative [Syntrophotalea carbinolica DSM 2380]|uniref:Cation transporter, putative n=1 Tax=Syntrophotalea carbinolica (strain DSM 2380 / NBRC 103641 / GraBd1) TaxID=338963 RepID=Q3A662_SYNC1|nr:calcium/sodium antiporter [Syntrophotalea carbinolica]ABA88145.1 cation transporter, putative [Syntrophotalea carbinolica DSM 2380]